MPSTSSIGEMTREQMIDAAVRAAAQRAAEYFGDVTASRLIARARANFIKYPILRERFTPYWINVPRDQRDFIRSEFRRLSASQARART